MSEGDDDDVDDDEVAPTADIPLTTSVQDAEDAVDDKDVEDNKEDMEGNQDKEDDEEIETKEDQAAVLDCLSVQIGSFIDIFIYKFCT